MGLFNFFRKPKKETKSDRIWKFIEEHQDDDNCASGMASTFSIPYLLAKRLILTWAACDIEGFTEMLDK